MCSTLILIEEYLKILIIIYRHIQKSLIDFVAQKIFTEKNIFSYNYWDHNYMFVMLRI